MAGYKTTWAIFREAGGDAGIGAGVTVPCRPDALALAAEEGIAALEGMTPAPGVLEPSRVLLFAADCRGGGAARLAARARAQAANFAFPLVHPPAGCAATVLRERGLALAGALVATLGLAEGRAGGGGALFWPVAATALPALLAEGVCDVVIPEVHRIECRGELAAGVGGVDVGLYVAAQFGPGGAAGVVLEFGGPAVAAMEEGARDALVNAAALCGPGGVLCAPGVAAESNAQYEYDFGHLTPQYAKATAEGFAVAPLAEAPGAFINRVIVGPSAAADDIAIVARALAGKSVHSDVELWVAPASRRVHFDALSAGHLGELIRAGATVMPSCALPWADELAAGGPGAATGVCAFEVGRERGVEVYYVNPAAAAAAAVAGELCAPMPVSL